jgi:hypothetical protein
MIRSPRSWAMLFEEKTIERRGRGEDMREKCTVGNHRARNAMRLRGLKRDKWRG